MVHQLEPKNVAITTELHLVAEMLQRLAGSSSAVAYTFRTPVPRVVDTQVAKLDREKSESYWRERFAASVGPPSHLHRGTSGKPCRAYNQAPNGCPKGSACPDSHAVDVNSLRVEGCDGNTCLHHRPGQNGTAAKANQAKDVDDCPYGHPAVMDPETEAAFKEIEALLFQEGGKKGLSPLDSLRA
jgi:hypothetical protein